MAKKMIKVNLLKNVSDIFIRREDIYSKFGNLYSKNKEQYDEALKESRLVIKLGISEQDENFLRRRVILSVIAGESEDKIINILDRYYHDVIKQINDDVKFEECKLPDKPNKVIEFYIIYKFISVLLNKESEISEYDERMLVLLDKINNYTKENIMKDEEKMLLPCRKPDDTGINGFFYGSAELYSFFMSAFLDNDIPIDIIESTKLNKKDMEDLIYYIEELFFFNRNGGSFINKFYANTDEESKKFIKHIPFQYLSSRSVDFDALDNDAIYTLYLIGSTIKMFSKLYHKEKDKYNDLNKKYKSLVSINEKRICENKNKEELDQLKKEIEKLKEDNKNLSIEKERLNKRYDILNDENNKLREDKEILNNNITDLEEYIKTIDSDEDTENKLTSRIDRIVLTEEEAGNTVLIGGHIKFQQKLLEKYPNIRVIDIDVARVNDQLIKNSELVLLNVKYMSHRIFEAAMNIIRKNGIKFRYI